MTTTHTQPAPSNHYNPQQLLAFRDELTRVLSHQISLLHEMTALGLVPFHKENHDLMIDDKHLPEMVKLLEGEKHKLQNFDVILAIVGTMKAGKSTTINAIVGKEIMPNRNRPMTAIPTLICHKKGQTEPRITFNNHPINDFLEQVHKYLKLNTKSIDNLQPELQKLCMGILKGVRFENNSIGAKRVFNVLSHFNDLVRLSEALEIGVEFPFSSYRDIHQLPIIEVEFDYLKNAGPSSGRLMLLDTPGPNEAKQPQLKVMLEEQLRRSSAVVLVLDYTQLKSEAEAEVRDQLSKIPKIDQSRLYTFVNKFDQKNANADDARMTKVLVSSDLLAGRIQIDRVYPISAQDAYLANRLSNYMRVYREKPVYVESSWVADFAKKAFGEIDEEEWAEYSEKTIHRRIERLLERSNIKEPVEQVIVSANDNAPYLAICSALVDVDKVFNDIKNVFSINGYFSRQVELNEQDLERIKAAIVQMQQDQKKVNELSKKLTHEFKDSLAKLKKDLNRSAQRIIFDVESQTQRAIAKLSSEMDKNLLDAQQKYREASALPKILRMFKGNKSEGENSEVSSKDKRREAAAQLAASEDSRENQLTSKILTVSAQDKEAFFEMMNDVTLSLSVMANDHATQAVQTHLGIMQQGLEEIQEEYRQSFDSIKRKFSNEGIDLKVTLPSHFAMTPRSVNKIEFKQTSVKSEMRTKVIEQSGAWGWMKRAAATPFSADWGTDDVEYELYQVDLVKISGQIAEAVYTRVIKPIISEAEFDVGVKSGSIDEYAVNIQAQVDSLLNELQQAIENEKLPYEEKARRKDKLNQIAKQNFKVEGRIQFIKEAFNI